MIPWTPFERAEPIWPSEETITHMATTLNISVADVRAAMIERLEDEIWKNSRYQVVIDRVPLQHKGWPKLIHLSIKRLDREPIHDWRDLQRIKNELISPEHEAVELYPAESRLVDGANQYHLWVLRDKIKFPFGFQERLVSFAPLAGLAKQREQES